MIGWLVRWLAGWLVDWIDTLCSTWHSWEILLSASLFACTEKKSWMNF